MQIKQSLTSAVDKVSQFKAKYDNWVLLALIVVYFNQGLGILNYYAVMDYFKNTLEMEPS